MISRNVRDVEAVRALLAESAGLKTALRTMASQIAVVADLLEETFRNGNKVILCGNGGSLCDAVHFSEELIGRFHGERRPLPAIVLSEPGALTCIGNDYGYADVFRRQVEALADDGDLVIGLTTSGASPNVLAALHEAHGRGARTLALTGAKGLNGVADCVLTVPSEKTERVQEGHMVVIHIVCALLDERFGAKA